MAPKKMTRTPRTPRFKRPLNPKKDTGLKDRDGKPIFTSNKLKDINGNEFVVLERPEGYFYLVLTFGGCGLDEGQSVELGDGSAFRNITFNW